MKTIIRNFLSVLRRFKMATGLNILGLSVAFAAFMVIMMQVIYDLGFNKSIKDADCIYRVETIFHGRQFAINSRYMLEDLTRKSPAVVAGSISDPYIAHSDNESSFFSVERNGEKVWFIEDDIDISADFVRVFSFEMLEGTADVIKEPNTVLIPESMARKMFGNEAAVQKQLTGEDFTWTVGGVYKDFLKNTSVANVIYKEVSAERDNNTEYGNLNFEAYVKLDKPSSAEGLLDAYLANVEDEDVKETFSFVLTPLTQIHYNTTTEFDATPKTSKSMIFVLIGIAIVILLIATINFTNYSIALTPLRIKSINTQKVLGATEKGLRSSLIMEAVITCFIAWLLAIGLTYLLSISSVASLLDADIHLQHYIALISGVGCLAIIVGLFAGIYPAYYITSFAPALVLKGSFGLSPKGRQLRNSLVSIQFVASFILIIAALFMYLQTHFVTNASLGYNKEQLLVVNINNDVRKSLDSFKNELLHFPGIEDVTFGCDLLSGTDIFSQWGRDWKGENITYQVSGVGLDFLKTIGIPLLEGRDFLPTDKPTETTRLYYVFNEKARKEFGFSIGDKLSDGEIIGFIPDVNVTSLRKEIEPMAFALHDEYYFGKMQYAYVRVKANADMYKTMDQIHATLQTISPQYAFDIRPYDNILRNVYDKENNLTSLITWFSLIAVLISIVGVFGLVVFESEYKRKEVGVRKVLGSTTTEILAMFNKRYVRILAICFIVAAPIAWYAIHTWLQNFAYKTPMYWWVFAISFLVVTMITTATVTFQSWQVANANPVDSIKTE